MKQTAIVLSFLCASALVHVQDPKPETAAPATVRETPPGTPERHRYEGVYELKRRVVDGIDDVKPNHGYLAITRRHLILTLAQPGLDDRLPLVHAGVRTWEDSGDDVRTTVKLDYYSDSGGTIHLMPRGKQEIRELRLIRGGLQVMQGTRTWLEFERIE